MNKKIKNIETQLLFDNAQVPNIVEHFELLQTLVSVSPQSFVLPGITSSWAPNLCSVLSCTLVFFLWSACEQCTSPDFISWIVPLEYTRKHLLLRFTTTIVLFIIFIKVNYFDFLTEVLHFLVLKIRNYISSEVYYPHDLRVIAIEKEFWNVYGQNFSLLYLKVLDKMYFGNKYTFRFILIFSRLTEKSPLTMAAVSIIATLLAGNLQTYAFLAYIFQDRHFVPDDQKKPKFVLISMSTLNHNFRFFVMTASTTFLFISFATLVHYS